MKKRDCSACGNCKKQLKTSSSVKFERSCCCNKIRTQKSAKSCTSGKSRSKSRCNQESHHEHHQLQEIAVNLNERKSPVRLIESTYGENPITNLKISNYEFPSTVQTARNQGSQALFVQDLNKPPYLQQPFQNTQHFTTHSGLYYSPLHSNFNTQSPFKQPHNYLDSMNPVRSFSPAQRDMGTTFTPSKQIKDHYERVIQTFETYSRERMSNLRDGLTKIIDGLKADEIITTMREDPLSQNFAFLRMKEVIDNAMVTESEQVIGNLRMENTMLRERVLYLEAEGQKKVKQDQAKVDKQFTQIQSRKEHYKNQLRNSQDQMTLLIKKFQDLEADLDKRQLDFEIKLAQKDQELARCDKALTEVREILSEKQIAQSKVENNLGNEVTVLSERIISLEKERNDLIDKYQRYGEEFKLLLNQEQSQYSVKMVKQKEQIKELKVKVEKSENHVKELETQARNYVKEIDEQKYKAEVLAKQVQEKGFKLKDVKEKRQLTEKDFESILKDYKQKHKTKIHQLQSTFDATLKEKCLQLEAEAKDKLVQVDADKQDIEAKYKELQIKLTKLQEESQQQMIVMQKQTDKKMEKLQQKNEKDIKDKIIEAEEQSRELEEKMRKEFKKEKKELNKENEQRIQEQLTQFKQLQGQYENEFKQMSNKMREEIESQKINIQNYKIKIAELNIIVDTQKADKERITKENDKLVNAQKDLINNQKGEVRELENKLKLKIKENDDKVKSALDTAIRHQNLEQMAQQYAHEIDKKEQEIDSQKEFNCRLQIKIDKLNEDIKQREQNLSDLRIVLNDKEIKICKIQSCFKETSQKIFSYAKLTSNKYKTEMEYMKKNFISDLEMSKKQMENQLHTIINKIRENNYNQKFKLEKLQYNYEQRFQKEFNAREVEWEKVWEKREEIMENKDKTIKELEKEKSQLRETIIKLESEISKVKTLNQINEKDLHRQCDDLKKMLGLNEQKHSELSQIQKKQQEQLSNQQRQQLQDLKLQMQSQQQEELKKLENEINEQKEKSKKKIFDLTESIQEMQSKHKFEIVNLKNVYEQKIGNLETENESKQKAIYEGQNSLNILTIKYEQFVKDNEIQRNLNDQLVKSQSNFDSIVGERDQLSKNLSELESQASDLKSLNNTLQTQLLDTERKIAQQRKELKQKNRMLNQSRKREQQETQFLNDVLTKSASSSNKLSRRSQVKSPEFKGQRRSNNGQIVSRVRMTESVGNYTNILSEINNIIDDNQHRHSSMNKNLIILRDSSNQRAGDNLLSPSVTQLAPSVTFYHKSALISPNNENISLKLSDLRQQ